MKRLPLKRGVAVLMSLLMLFGAVPQSAYASQDVDSETSIETVIEDTKPEEETESESETEAVTDQDSEANQKGDEQSAEAETAEAETDEQTKPLEETAEAESSEETEAEVSKDESTEAVSSQEQEEAKEDETSEPAPPESESETEEAKPLFAEIAADSVLSIDQLNAIDFSSKRLLVAGPEDLILDPERILSSYEGVYLLQYEDMETTKNAYSYYYGKAVFADVDYVMSVASGDGSASGQSAMTAEGNPIALLAASNMDKVSGQVIALIDTGVNGSDNIVSAVSMIGSDPSDANGHGTKMAQLIREQNPNAQILSIKALGADGTGDMSAVYAAVKYAVSKGAKIILLPISAVRNTDGLALEDVFASAEKAGAKVIVAAGNNGNDIAGYVPARLKHVTVIGAADKDGVKLGKSNSGSAVKFNLIADSTSEASAKYAGYLSAGGKEEADNKLIFQTDYVKQETQETQEEQETQKQEETKETKPAETEKDGKKESETSTIKVSSQDGVKVTVKNGDKETVLNDKKTDEKKQEESSSAEIKESESQTEAETESQTEKETEPAKETQPAETEPAKEETSEESSEAVSEEPTETQSEEDVKSEISEDVNKDEGVIVSVDKPEDENDVIEYNISSDIGDYTVDSRFVGNEKLADVFVPSAVNSLSVNIAKQATPEQLRALISAGSESEYIKAVLGIEVVDSGYGMHAKATYVDINDPTFPKEIEDLQTFDEENQISKLHDSVFNQEDMDLRIFRGSNGKYYAILRNAIIAGAENTYGYAFAENNDAGKIIANGDLFDKNYGIIEITPDTFDMYVTGTTGFQVQVIIGGDAKNFELFRAIPVDILDQDGISIVTLTMLVNTFTGEMELQVARPGTEIDATEYTVKVNDHIELSDDALSYNKSTGRLKMRFNAPMSLMSASVTVPGNYGTEYRRIATDNAAALANIYPLGVDANGVDHLELTKASIDDFYGGQVFFYDSYYSYYAFPNGTSLNNGHVPDPDMSHPSADVYLSNTADRITSITRYGTVYTQAIYDGAPGDQPTIEIIDGATSLADVQAAYDRHGRRNVVWEQGISSVYGSSIRGARGFTTVYFPGFGNAPVRITDAAGNKTVDFTTTGLENGEQIGIPFACSHIATPASGLKSQLSVLNGGDVNTKVKLRVIHVDKTKKEVIFFGASNILSDCMNQSASGVFKLRIGDEAVGDVGVYKTYKGTETIDDGNRPALTNVTVAAYASQNDAKNDKNRLGTVTIKASDFPSGSKDSNLKMFGLTLEIGKKYYIKEVSVSPASVNIDTQVYEVTASENKTSKTGSNAGNVAHVTNTYTTPTYLRARKLSNDTSITDSNTAYDVSGIQFKVYTSSACTTEAKDANGNSITLTSGSDGYTGTVQIAAGTYYVREVESSMKGKGFKYNSNPTKVTVSKANNKTAATAAVAEIKNQPYGDPINLTIKKIDGKTGKDVRRVEL